jgi:hypothetical protein
MPSRWASKRKRNGSSTTRAQDVDWDNVGQEQVRGLLVIVGVGGADHAWPPSDKHETAT